MQKNTCSGFFRNPNTSYVEASTTVKNAIALTLIYVSSIIHHLLCDVGSSMRPVVNNRRHNYVVIKL